MSFKIIGTGSKLPAKVVTNFDLEKIMDTSDEWIRTRTGIEERHIAVEETTASLSADACRAALDMAGVKPEEIDLIIVGTVSPDYCYPSTACQIQDILGVPGAIAFDINAACSGFLFAMQIADGYFKTGATKKALVVGAEVLSKMMDWDDRSTCVLFGDGAGAAVIEASEDEVVFDSGSDGTRGMSLSCKNRPVNNPFVKNDTALDYTSMDGQEVFKFATRTVPMAINNTLEKANISTEDVDVYLLHQANMRIIESVAKRLKAPLDKFPTTIQKCGNISAASVPILLDREVRNGNVKRGQRIVLAGFGAGLTWSACTLVF